MKFDKNFGWNNNSNSNSNVKTIQDNEFIKLLVDNDLIITIDDSFDRMNIIKVGENILYSREENVNLINYSMDNRHVVRIPYSMINDDIQIYVSIGI